MSPSSGSKPSEYSWHEHHRQLAAAHARAAQAATTLGERSMYEDLVDLHVRLAAGGPAHEAAEQRRSHHSRR
jgi:hypothetical protein